MYLKPSYTSSLSLSLESGHLVSCDRCELNLPQTVLAALCLRPGALYSVWSCSSLSLSSCIVKNKDTSQPREESREETNMYLTIISHRDDVVLTTGAAALYDIVAVGLIRFLS